LEVEKSREAYLRGEEAIVAGKAQASTDPVGPSELLLMIGDREVAKESIAPLSPGASAPFKLSMQTAGFGRGKHEQTLLWKEGGRRLAVWTRDLRLMTAPRKGSLELWLWMFGGPENAAQYKALGFDSVGGPVIPYSPDTSLEEQLKITNEIASSAFDAGLLLSVSPNGGLWRRNFAAVAPTDAAERWRYQQSWRNEDYFYDPFNPEVAAAQNGLNEAFVKTLAPWPNWTFAFIDMEHQDDLQKPARSPAALLEIGKMPGMTPEVLERLQPGGMTFSEAETGPPTWVAPGVVSGDDVRLMLTRRTFAGANGVNIGLERAKKVMDKYRPDIRLITNPFRANAVLGMYPAADLFGSWTYTNPDPKYMLFSDTLRAATRSGQGISHTITLLNYAGMLLPMDVGWTIASPDIVKLSSWIDLSRLPELLSYFHGSTADPFNQGGYDPVRMPEESFLAIREMSDRVYHPLGGLMRQLKMTPRRVALLNSQVARLYGKSPRLVSYNAYEILPFQAVAEMAHLSAEIVLDEQVEAGILERFDVLMLPKCDAITEPMLREIEKFQARGGLVVADQYLGPKLKNVEIFDFDFTRRSKVTADANLTGKTYADWNDQVARSKEIAMKQVEGETAEADQQRMEKYAAELRSRLDKRIPRKVDADSPQVMLSLAQGGGANYLFVINDKRTYSDRLKAYQSQLDQLVPQTPELRLFDEALADAAAYDLIRHERIAIQPGKPATMNVPLDRLGGTLVAFYPQAIASMSVNAPAKTSLTSPVSVDVKLLDKSGQAIVGIQPIGVTILKADGTRHEDSGYFTLHDGTGSFAFHATPDGGVGSWTILVLDLSSGQKSESQIQVSAH